MGEVKLSELCYERMRQNKMTASGVPKIPCLCKDRLGLEKQDTGLQRVLVVRMGVPRNPYICEIRSPSGATDAENSSLGPRMRGPSPPNAWMFPSRVALGTGSPQRNLSRSIYPLLSPPKSKDNMMPALGLVSGWKN